MKTYHVRIVDATRIDKVKPVYGPKGGPATKKRKVRVPAFRVQSVAKNGEILAVSEVLNDSKAVKKNISAMVSVWDSGVAFRELPGGTKIYDHTKKQSFARSGYANPKK